MVPPDDDNNGPIYHRYDDDAPINRYATLHDLSAVERRLTDQLKELRSSAWKLVGVILTGTAVLAAVIELVKQ